MWEWRVWLFILTMRICPSLIICAENNVTGNFQCSMIKCFAFFDHFTPLLILSQLWAACLLVQKSEIQRQSKVRLPRVYFPVILLILSWRNSCPQRSNSEVLRPWQKSFKQSEQIKDFFEIECKLFRLHASRHVGVQISAMFSAFNVPTQSYLTRQLDLLTYPTS